MWSNVNCGQSALHSWQRKVRILRRFLRGWAKSTSGTFKKEKLELNVLIDKLDKKAEFMSLSNIELNSKKAANERLAHLLREEEIKWYQRAKAKFILEGERNTLFYHLIANGKHRKQRIFQLEQEDGIIRGDVQLKNYITNYYKDLFGPAEVNLQQNSNFGL